MVDWSRLIPVAGNALTDLGYGLTQGNNVSSALKAAGQRTADMAQPRAQAEIMQRQEQERLQAIQRTVDALRKMGPKYEQFAVGVESRAMDPGQALAQAFQYSQQEKRGNAESWKRPANAQFIKDPQLRQAYLSGQFELADAIKMERGMASGDETYFAPTLLKQGDKFIYGQFSNRGNFREVPLPDGMDAIDPQTGAMLKSQGAAIGAGAGAAAIEIPGADQLASTVETQVDDLLKRYEKGMDEQFGRVLGIWPQQWSFTTPGTAKADFQNRVKQLMGESFLAARQLLKGGGPITDYEGKKADEAMSRMSTALENGSKEEFILAVQDFKAMVRQGAAKLRAQQALGAGGGVAPAAAGMPGGAPNSSDPLGIR